MDVPQWAVATGDRPPRAVSGELATEDAVIRASTPAIAAVVELRQAARARTMIDPGPGPSRPRWRASGLGLGAEIRANRHELGISAARMTGLDHATGDIIGTARSVRRAAPHPITVGSA